MIPRASDVKIVPNPTPEQQLTGGELTSVLKALSTGDGSTPTWTEKEAAEGRVIGCFEFDRCALICTVLKSYGYRATICSSGLLDSRQIVRVFLK